MLNSLSKLSSQGHLVGALVHVVSAGHGVYSEVEAAMQDGNISAEEARAIGERVAQGLGNIKIMVKGHDILHPAATEEILGGLARIARQIIIAER